MKVVIIGAGGLGREVKYLLDDVNAENKKKYKLIGFYDDFIPAGDLIFNKIPCLGPINTLANSTDKIGIIFGIGDVKVKTSILAKLKDNKSFTYPNIVHPKAYITKGTYLGKGNIICFGCFISCDVKIGNFNFMNTYCAIGHDAVIGDLNILMPRVQISGQVLIGDENFMGMSAAIVQGKKVGNQNIINGFTFLTKSISNKRIYFGVPGKKIN